MRFHISIFFLLLVAPGLALAAQCKLPASEELLIGCSHRCDFFYRWHLKNTARNLGHKIRIVDLREEASLEKVDAILMPGGADIDPKYYMNRVDSDLREYTARNLALVDYTQEGQDRDPFEYALLQNYINDDQHLTRPLLGICRGMQMMSVAMGLPLYLDIKTELGIPNRRHRMDRIDINKREASIMSKIHADSTVRGFKAHHQGLRLDYFEENQVSYPLVRVSAHSNDHLIAEALEYVHRPALGVQYHPERSFTTTSEPVFHWLLEKACQHKTKKD